MKKYKFPIIMAVVVILSVAIDLISKSIMETALNGETVPIIGDWLTLYFIINKGSAFGMFEGQSVFFFIITLVGLPLLVYILYRNRNQSLFGSIGLALMIGGTLGNAIDRAFLGDGFFNGGVRDFISVQGFAIFNIADSCLVVGVIIFIIALLFLDADAVFKKKEIKGE